MFTAYWVVLQKKQRRAHFESDDEEEEEEAGRGREEGRRRMEEARKSEISQASLSFCLECMYPLFLYPTVHRCLVEMIVMTKNCLHLDYRLAVHVLLGVDT